MTRLKAFLYFLLPRAGIILLALIFVFLAAACQKDEPAERLDKDGEKNLDKTLIVSASPSPTPGIDALTGVDSDPGVLLSNGFMKMEICNVTEAKDAIGYTITVYAENNENFPVCCAIMDICINGILCSPYEEFFVGSGEFVYETLTVSPAGGDNNTPESISFTFKVLTDDRAEDVLYTFTKDYALKGGIPSRERTGSDRAGTSVLDMEGTPLFTSNNCSVSITEAAVTETGGYRILFLASNSNTFTVNLALSSVSMDGILCPSMSNVNIPAGMYSYFTAEWSPETLFYYGIVPEAIGSIAMDISILKYTDTSVKTLKEISARYNTERAGREVDLACAECLMTTADVAVYAIGLEENEDSFAMRLCMVSHSDRTVGIRVTEATLAGNTLDSVASGTLTPGMMLMPCIQWEKSLGADGIFTALITVVDEAAPATALNSHTVSVDIH